MKIDKKIIFMIVLLSFISLLFFKQRNMEKEFRNFPSKLEIVFEEKDEIYKKLLDGKEKMEKNYIISETEEHAISLEGKNINVIGVDESYTAVYAIEAIYGEWPSRENQIVLSQNFAKDIFESEDVLGKIVDISEKTYEVIGTYEGEKYLKTDMENIYVRIEDIPQNSESSVYSLQFKPKDTKREFFIKEKFMEDISKVISKRELDELKIVDFTDSYKNLSKYYAGFIFLFKFSILVILTIFIIGYIRLSIKKYQEGIKKKYGKEFLSENATEILSQVFIIILLAFFWVFLLRMIVDFKLSTPDRFLPPFNIFDTEFYSASVEAFRGEYAMTVGDYGKIYLASLKVAKDQFIISTILLIVFLITSISYIKEKFKWKENKRQTERSDVNSWESYHSEI